ncbi:polyprenyl synthetase family protein [Flavobacteriaceae bacterium]|nr:polyprenyl synthetase family protein [Flavobacteriaceae bacterium]
MDFTKYKNDFLGYLQENKYTQEPQNLYEPVNYILSIGGKRMRPILTLMSAELFNESYDNAIPAAMAVEVFHNFTLLHDDIMDDAPLRRGQATVHEKWDVNTAILSGDVMMIYAYEFLRNYEPQLFSELMAVFNRTAIEVCEGQQMDVDFEDRNDVSIQEYMEMIKLKTSVLVACALKMGALVGGASKQDAQAMYQFGLNLGLAFQLQDDYLDAFGNPETFGKQVGGDIIENKKTYLYIEGLKTATAEDRKALEQWFTLESFDQEKKIFEVKAIFERSGSKKAIQNEIEKYTDQAIKDLGKLNLSEAKKDQLKAFAHYLMKRKV